MAYSTSNPPRMMVPAVGSNSPSWWSYDSADAATVVRVTGYITDGYDLGMKVGDIVIQSDAAGATVAHIYVVVSVAAGGAADLSDGTAIVVTDTD
jgi:hypothetical protein